ncbi:hypothetical protein [Sporosarcina ureae]|uniref:hypothetical protein n=1 Tax=Sporosarcina ureae TaxID=1571 RepID=UPI0026F1CBD8|nr:hypothetical protein [Sporosarcina ureae]
MDLSDPDELKFSAWVTEWQWQSGVEDLQQVQGLDRAQVFAAYFNEKTSSTSETKWTMRLLE